MRKKKRINHDLKILTEYFTKVMSGNKNFEIRLNDRDFKSGDNVTLKEFSGSKFTGREGYFRIGFVTNYEQKEDYVVFALLPRLEA